MIQTAAEPPNQGRRSLAASGWTRNRRQALAKMVRPKSSGSAGRVGAWAAGLLSGFAKAGRCDHCRRAGLRFATGAARAESEYCGEGNLRVRGGECASGGLFSSEISVRLAGSAAVCGIEVGILQELGVEFGFCE